MKQLENRECYVSCSTLFESEYPKPETCNLEPPKPNLKHGTLVIRLPVSIYASRTMLHSLVWRLQQKCS